jgi:glyoxylase-like metal-dependent hydrolase (beta-lactamase superfamily II)
VSQPENPAVHAFFEAATATYSYIVHAPQSKSAVIIDPVLDYDPKSGHISTTSAAELIECVHAHGLSVDWILETHAHADHLSAAQWLKRQLGGRPRVAIGRGITSVQEVFRGLLGLGAEFAVDGSQFDRLLTDDQEFMVGPLRWRVMPTPGHTQDSVSYIAGDAAFIGDTLFMPDYGTARCDFPGGDARTLYRSIRQILLLPKATRIFVCHDYAPTDRQPRHETTPAEQRAANIHVKDGVTEEQFVDMRVSRDKTLPKPVLLWPAVQVNIRAGFLPSADSSGKRFLRIPLSGEIV